MEKKEIDWNNLGFGYIKTDKRYVSNYKNGAWDDGAVIEDDMITMSECACVLQYAQTVFEGLKAYTTEDGRIVTFRPDLNADRLVSSAERLEMPVFPKDRFIDAVIRKYGFEARQTLMFVRLIESTTDSKRVMMMYNKLMQTK